MPPVPQFLEGAATGGRGKSQGIVALQNRPIAFFMNPQGQLCVIEHIMHKIITRSAPAIAAKTAAKTAAKVVVAAAALAALSGCAAPAFVSPVEVTRFVGPNDAGGGNAELAQGTISIVPAPGLNGDSLEYDFYRAAVQMELEQLGYRIVTQGAAQVAQLGFAERTGKAGEDGGPVSVGVGGSTGSFGSGLGVGIGLDLTPRPADQINTVLTVAIRLSEGGVNLWEGRAAMTATVNSDFAPSDARAGKLADALFADFPGDSGETVIVE